MESRENEVHTPHRPPARRRVWVLAAGVCAWIGANLAIYSILQSRELPPRTERFQLPSNVAGLYEQGEWARGEGQSPLRYRLMSPAKPGASGKSPLVVFLHGAGERGNDNTLQLKNLPRQMAEASWRDRFSCFLLAPQCPAGSHWSVEADAVLALIESLCKYHPIDRQRVYLTGYSMGGFGSWRLAAQRPEMFAALAPLCGGGDPEQAVRLAPLPIWAIHGDADDVVPVSNTRRMIDAVRKAGGDPHYSELAGVGHNCWSATYQDPDGIVAWMFQQKRAAQ